MSGSRLVTTIWFCSRTAFSDLWIEPAGGYFLPRADELPSYGFSYVAQSEQALRLAFLWDLNNTKWCNGFVIEFRQNLTKETFSYDEHLKS